MVTDPEITKTIERNRKRFETFGVHPRSLGWREGSQEVRFQAFFKDFISSGAESLLDIGCGFGDLLVFLRKRGWTGTYIGVDLVPEYIEVAREIGDDNAELICGSFSDIEASLSVDASFASGLTNHRREDDNLLFVETLFESMTSRTNIYVALDFLSTTVDRRRKDLFLYDPCDIAYIAMKRGKRFQIDHSYMPFEFMLKFWCKDKVAEDLPYFSDESAK